jgi:hypothetical protein
MRRLLAVTLVLTSAGCAATGYSGSAYLTAGRLDLKERTPTLEACAEAVRTATKIPDPSHLGQFVMRDGVPEGDMIGICGGPDGRMYFITPTEIQPGPTVIFER